MSDMAISKIILASKYASEKHAGQFRKGNHDIPYINHPIKVTHVLASVGAVEDEDVLAASLLHDVLEDTDTTFQELVNIFGERVAQIVAEVSDEKDLEKAERKALQIKNAKTLSYEAKLIRIADKVCNVQDICGKYAPKWSYEQKYEYIEWAKAVVDEIAGTHEVLENYFYDEHRWGRLRL